MRAKLLGTLLSIFILFSAAHAYNGYQTYSSSYTGFSYIEDSNQIQIDMKGAAIPPTSSIYVDYRFIGDYDSLDFYINSVSTGNITTANIDWMMADKTTIVTSNTLTSGTAQTTMRSSFVRFRIYNYETITANVTGNILFVRK